MPPNYGRSCRMWLPCSSGTTNSISRISKPWFSKHWKSQKCWLSQCLATCTGNCRLTTANYQHDDSRCVVFKRKIYTSQENFGQQRVPEDSTDDHKLGIWAWHLTWLTMCPQFGFEIMRSDSVLLCSLSWCFCFHLFWLYIVCLSWHSNDSHKVSSWPTLAPFSSNAFSRNAPTFSFFFRTGATSVVIHVVWEHQSFECW